MSRISAKFQRLRGEGRQALISFLVAGSPSFGLTKRSILALEEGGADLIELGIPFSDPMADGPVIQNASEKGLRRGVTLAKVLKLVANVRSQTNLPILLMGYYNPIWVYGLDRFAREASRVGVDAVLVVDLPPEESEELERLLRRRGIDLIYLLAPTSDRRRIQLVSRRARGFIYFVSVTGITGAKLTQMQKIRKKIAAIRKVTSLPIVVGFGIRTVSQAVGFKFADGVVIGSSLVERLDRSKSPEALRRFLTGFRTGLDASK